MIRVRFDPAALTGDDKQWWVRWSERAARATKTICDQMQAGEQPSFESAVWKDLKDFLMRVAFNGKCGYCESRIDDTSWGDAEHYRPKGKVTIKKGTRAETIRCSEDPHPGYYWLAYDWRNLIPACQRCNGGTGKMNHFPVAKKHACRESDESPDDLDNAEEPLLLNPYKDTPGGHLLFGAKGVVAARDGDARGAASIEVYGLMRNGLTASRQEYQERAWTSFLLHAGTGNDIGPLMEKLRKEPHSTAAIQYIQAMLDEQQRALNERLSGDSEDDSEGGG